MGMTLKYLGLASMRQNLNLGTVLKEHSSSVEKLKIKIMNQSHKKISRNKSKNCSLLLNTFTHSGRTTSMPE